MLTDFACITSQEKKDVAGSSICSTIIDIKKNTCFASIFTFSCNFNISNPYGFDMNLQSRVLNYFNQEYQTNIWRLRSMVQTSKIKNALTT